MKRFALFLAPLMAVSFLTNCGGPKQYTVTFDSDGGEHIAPVSVNYNETLSQLPIPTHPDVGDIAYIFDRWQKPDGTTFTTNTKVTSDITITAIWEQKNIYTVTFDSDGGSQVPSQRVIDGKNVTKPINPTHDSSPQYTYSFNEWQLDGAKFDFAKPITKNVTLKADWSVEVRKYTITWKIDGSETPIKTEQVAYDETPDFGGVPTKPARDQEHYYVFSHWEPEIKKVANNQTYIAYFDELETKTTYLHVQLASGAFPRIIFELNGTDGFLVDWGDGSPINQEKEHEYSVCKEYDIKIRCQKADNYAFSCQHIAAPEIPDANDYITNITLSHLATSIPNYAFSSCISLSSVNIFDGITSIGKEAFWSSDISSISIPSSVISISESAFSSCSSLTSIFIPDSVTTMGASVFNNCRNLTDIYCEAKEKPVGWNANWLGNIKDNVHLHWGASV